MKRTIIGSIILSLVIILLGYNIYSAKVQKTNFSLINKNIETIKILNKDFDLYLKNLLTYDNFDLIEQKIKSFNDNFEKIYSNKILNDITNHEFKTILSELKHSSKIKIEKISKVKSYRAILNNSFRILQKMGKHISSSDYENLYVSILTSDKNPEIEIKSLLKDLNKLKYNNKYEKYFLTHAKTILENEIKLQNMEQQIKELHLNQRLNKLHFLYEEFTENTVQRANLSIGTLFTLMVIIIILYLIHEYKLVISNDQLYRFRKTVENSDNIVVVTDENERIKYVNEEFTRSTGYTLKEVLGKKPSILRSGQQSRKFYNKLQNTIHSGKKWRGEFININKHGELSYEKASITPVFDDKGKIKEFIAIKLDITNETIRGQELKEKEKLLIQQSKMAAMGEMIQNIAHQWRQPLSLISTISTGLAVQKEYGISNEQDELEKLNKINSTAQYLSETINDFRDFFKPNKEKTLFNLKDIYLKTIKLINSKFKTLEIKVIENINDVEIVNLDNEAIQVIMNILSNAKDVLESKQDQKRFIFVDIYKDNNNAIVQIKDNGGGIGEDIIERVFDPYFTTKHKSQGTGIGLYMSHEMVYKHMNGTLTVENVDFTHESTNYKGACFTFALPLKTEDLV